MSKVNLQQVKMKRIRILAIVAGLVLLLVHISLSYSYTDTVWKGRKNKNVSFTVFTPEAYKVISMGMNDVVSRLIVSAALFNPLNENIPSINFDRLTTALRGSSFLDPRDTQPYLYVGYFWSWAKGNDSQRYMAEYMKTGLDNLPKMWDIPYTIYLLTKDRDKDEALVYLKMAAERATLYDGPAWIVDYPAILMSRDGEDYEALGWLQEAYKRTENEKHRKAIEDQMETILKKIEEGKGNE